MKIGIQTIWIIILLIIIADVIFFNKRSIEENIFWIIMAWGWIFFMEKKLLTP